MVSSSSTSSSAPAPKSYGTVVIQDGTYFPSSSLPDERQRRAPVRMAGEPPAIPPKFVPSGDMKTFVVNLHYTKSSNIFSGGGVLPSGLFVSYEKQFKRITSDKNPVRDVKFFVSQFSGCAEASKLRRRAIALSRIHNTISNETFRFGVQDP